MNINWYPGHMTKAIRMIRQDISLIDVVIYVLDSRAPFSCLNPDFDEIVGKLPIIFVLNKSDLGDKTRIDFWKRFFETEKNDGGKNSVVVLNSTLSSAPKLLLPIIRRAAMDKLNKYKSKGVNKSVRVMVIGVPNSGKSTLINSLCGSKKTMTGNIPGVTRGKQWVRIDDNTEILDTPGTLYPKISDQTAARRLAYIGSIKDAIVDTYELALSFSEEMTELYPDRLKERYKINELTTPEATLAAIGKSRGFLLKAGEPDLERAATAIIEDFRKGRLGKITLDPPSPLEPPSSDTPSLDTHSLDTHSLETPSLNTPSIGDSHIDALAIDNSATDTSATESPAKDTSATESQFKGTSATGNQSKDTSATESQFKGTSSKA